MLRLTDFEVIVFRSSNEKQPETNVMNASIDMLVLVISLVRGKGSQICCHSANVDDAQK